MAFCRGKNQKLLFKVDSDIEVSQEYTFVSKAFSFKAILLQQKNKKIKQNCSKMKEKIIFTTALCLSAMTQMMAQNNSR